MALSTARPAAPLPDGWYDVYRWFHRLTSSTDTAEELTVEVCRRLRLGHPAWLAAKAVNVQQRFFVVQIMLERHGVVSDSLRGSTGRQRPRSAESAAAGDRHMRSPMGGGPVGSWQPAGNNARPGGMVGARVAEILASLAAGGPADSWPAQLVGDCQVATQMSGVGLTMTAPASPAAALAATSGHAQRMEDLQFALGEGPSVDAARSGRPVLIADLTGPAAQRWAAFTPEAISAGVHAAFTFPLQVGAIGIGVLDLYRATPGGLTDSELGQALAFVDAAVAVLLHLQDRAGVSAGRDDADGMLADHATGLAAGAPVELARAMESRAVVHQATGVISVQLDVNLAVALLRLRAHAFAAGRSILEVAADVVARRLSFDDSDAGTAATPGQRRHTIGDEESS